MFLFLILLLLAGHIGLLGPVPVEQGTTIPNPPDFPIEDGAWPMAAANPERTSWSPEEVRGNLNVEWYRPLEPYIHYKTQPIAANGKIYVSTARGLYAFSANDGALLWVYPTELPLGNSPTIATVNGRSVAFVGGYDRQIHAVDGETGEAVAGYTAYLAGAGFETNPLVINNRIYAGNRDGQFYALDASTGSLVWRFETGGPILQSAAYRAGALYFASNDAHAYALNAADGALRWRSDQLPGSGFHSYWPVAYTNPSTGTDYVIFTGGENYRFRTTNLVIEESDAIYQGLGDSQVIGTTSTSIAGDWAPGTVAVDAGILIDYFEEQPHRRTVFVLEATTGQEHTFDSDGDGAQEYAPFNWAGVTHSGSKYPPLVNGIDGVYYQATGYIAPGWISRSGPVGWKFGTQYISRVDGNGIGHASDEPMAYSSGGRLIYWSLCCDREAGAFDVNIPYGEPERSWTYYVYNLASNALAPGYQQLYDTGDEADYNNENGWQVYSGLNQSRNGVYGKHGTAQSPPIPYRGKLYMLRGNALLAFSPTGTNPQSPLPLVEIEEAEDAAPSRNRAEVSQRLEDEVQRLLAAGPLRPGYHDSGFIDLYGNGGFTDARTFGEIFDYFQNPADTVYTLLLAYPYLSATLQQQVSEYLQTHYGPGAVFDFTEIVHVGWGTGAPREATIIPPEIIAQWGDPYASPFDPSNQPTCGWCGYWEWYPPFSFYAAWQYAEIVGEGDENFARAIFDQIDEKLELPLADATLLEKPYWLNQYLAGYFGYLALQTLAGYPEDQQVRATYEDLLRLRLEGFDKDAPFPAIGSGAANWEMAYHNSLAVARNFMFLTPELGQILGDQIRPEVREAIEEYEYVAPYWFVSKFDNSYGEGSFQHLYDYPALFQAKTFALNQPFQELSKWLDAPAFPVGDLFYIQNLAAALAAPDAAPVRDFSLEVMPSIQVIEAGGVATYRVEIEHSQDFTGTVTLELGNSPSPEVTVEIAPPLAFPPPGGSTTVTVTDLHASGQVAPTGYYYSIPVTAVGNDIVKRSNIGLLVTSNYVFLPIFFGLQLYGDATATTSASLQNEIAVNHPSIGRRKFWARRFESNTQGNSGDHDCQRKTHSPVVFDQISSGNLTTAATDIR